MRTIRIFGYRITIDKPDLPLGGLCAKEVESFAMKEVGYEKGGIFRKIARIRVVRTLRPGTGLKDAKDWVESQFHDAVNATAGNPISD